jgi:hypothetical protein
MVTEDTPQFGLYHWSPTDRRKSIQRSGLVPGKASVIGGRGYRVPVLCFSDNPMIAWNLSGRLFPEVTSWDLWMMWSDVPSIMEEIPFDNGDDPAGEYIVKEYRVYEPVKRGDLWLVATRTQEPAKPLPGTEGQGNLRAGRRVG